jgi:hypothetical protein
MTRLFAEAAKSPERAYNLSLASLVRLKSALRNFVSFRLSFFAQKHQPLVKS